VPEKDPEHDPENKILLSLILEKCYITFTEAMAPRLRAAHAARRGRLPVLVTGN
jgi:hypothetical protein